MAGVDSEDYELICTFLRRVHGTLDDVVDHLHGLIPMTDSNLGHHAALKDAWAEWKVQSDPGIEGRSADDSGPPARLDAIEVHIKSGAVDAELIGHGLTGRQLQFKLAIFNARYAVFKGMGNPSAPRPGFLVRLLLRYRNRQRDRAATAGREAAGSDVGAGA